ncbi:hypothetical protein EDB84DRAFT_1436227 [Lactarius hengduanensis]|nr:hypothetical protein EDB84DRAFT_1436227 [Lactarius hengduanensis]
MYFREIWVAICRALNVEHLGAREPGIFKKSGVSRSACERRTSFMVCVFGNLGLRFEEQVAYLIRWSTQQHNCARLLTNDPASDKAAHIAVSSLVEAPWATHTTAFASRILRRTSSFKLRGSSLVTSATIPSPQTYYRELKYRALKIYSVSLLLFLDLDAAPVRAMGGEKRRRLCHPASKTIAPDTWSTRRKRPTPRQKCGREEGQRK